MLIGGLVETGTEEEFPFSWRTQGELFAHLWVFCSEFLTGNEAYCHVHLFAETEEATRRYCLEAPN